MSLPCYLHPTYSRICGSSSWRAVSTLSLALSGLLTLLYLLLAAWYFTRTYRYAVRSGLLAHYSAENAA